MNQPDAPTPSDPSPTPPPLVADDSLGPILEALLKRPAALIAALHQARTPKIALWLGALSLIALAAYGFVVGSFSGGAQLYLAPLKVSLGAFASLAICLPSLFIFACLTGANVSLRGILGVACAFLALTTVLLIGFLPVAWVFSQSTHSVSFMGALHLLFWIIGVLFGLRLLGKLMDLLHVKDRPHLHIWGIIFILVSLQMTTALRPIVGTAPTVLPAEKRFFLAHWIQTIASEAD